MGSGSCFSISCIYAAWSITSKDLPLSVTLKIKSDPLLSEIRVLRFLGNKFLRIWSQKSQIQQNYVFLFFTFSTNVRQKHIMSKVHNGFCYIDQNPYSSILTVVNNTIYFSIQEKNVLIIWHHSISIKDLALGSELWRMLTPYSKHFSHPKLVADALWTKSSIRNDGPP